jgi:hypothetical protein
MFQTDQINIVRELNDDIVGQIVLKQYQQIIVTVY